MGNSVELREPGEVKTIKSSKMKQTVLLRKQINNACFVFTVQCSASGFEC